MDVAASVNAEYYRLRVVLNDGELYSSTLIDLDTIVQSKGKVIEYALKDCYKKIKYEKAQRKSSHVQDALTYASAFTQDFTDYAKPFTKASIEPIKMPKFNQYSSKWPLGPEGHFYTSMGRVVEIAAMKDSYLESTLRWLERTFDFSQHKFARDKYNEMLAQRVVR